MIVLGQISDTHILETPAEAPSWMDNNDRLEKAVKQLNAEPVPPAAVIATGDLVNSGKPEQYAQLQEILAPLEMPVLPLPGNHDSRQPFRDSFDMPWADADHLSWAVDVEGVRVIGMDVTVPGHDHGDFDIEREQWLRTELSSVPDQPTVLAMHQPPFQSGIDWMDSTATRNTNRFADVVRDFPCINRILCGHLHRPVQTTVAGVTTTVGLSTVYHVALNLAAGSSIELIKDPAGYQLHCHTGDHWVSHTRYINVNEETFTP